MTPRSSAARIGFKVWHILFGIVATVFAFLYLRDAFSVDGTTGDMVKGWVWVALALFMIVPEFVRRSGRRSSSGPHSD